MNKKVQGIIIKDNKVLIVKGINETNIKRNFFISGEVYENENDEDALKRVIKNQLNIDVKHTFKFKKDVVSGLKTFLVDLSNEDIDIDLELDNNLSCLNDIYTATSLVWIDLNDEFKFKDFEIQYIRLLIEECIMNSYDASWIDLAKEKYFKGSLLKEYLNNKYMEKEKIEIDSKEPISKKLLALLMSLSIGLLFNYFFVWKSIGISAVIFSLVVIGFSIYTAHNKIKANKRIGFVFLIPIILLSLSFSIYNNFVLRGLNVIIIPILLVSYILSIRYDNIKDINLVFVQRLLSRVFNKSFKSIPNFFKFIKEIKDSNKNVKKNSIKSNIIKGLLISLPLLIVILLLLSSADMMFKYYVENISEIFGDFSIGNLIGRLIIISIISIYSFGFLWSLKYENEVEKDNIRINRFFEPVTIITIIFVINIAYLLFSVVQFSYLYAGGLNVLPEGFSYAEYARKGFFELILVTLLNFTIIIFSINFTKKINKVINNIAKISYSLLILFTFNMLGSSLYKMHLYEQAFGFTRLRIFVQAFMILIGIILFIVLLGIWIEKVPIFKYSIISALIVYIALNFINVDKIIVRENILRYQETKKIDMFYIKQLSYDAIEEIDKLLEIGDTRIKHDIKEHIEITKRRLNREYDNWYEYNFYKSKYINH